MDSLLLLVTTALLGPCEYEDSPNCVWDASTEGNGVGSSFFDINGTVYYFAPIE